MSRYCAGDDDDDGGSIGLVPEPPPTCLLLRVFAAWRVNPNRGVGEEALAFGVNRSRVLPDVIGCAAVPSGGPEAAGSPAAPSSAIVTRVGIASEPLSLSGRLLQCYYNKIIIMIGGWAYMTCISS